MDRLLVLMWTWVSFVLRCFQHVYGSAVFPGMLRCLCFPFLCLFTAASCSSSGQRVHVLVSLLIPPSCPCPGLPLDTMSVPVSVPVSSVVVFPELCQPPVGPFMPHVSQTCHCPTVRPLCCCLLHKPAYTEPSWTWT